MRPIKRRRDQAHRQARRERLPIFFALQGLDRPDGEKLTLTVRTMNEQGGAMDQDKEFTVHDRRSSASEPSAGAEQPKTAGPSAPEQAGPGAASRQAADPMPELDFPAFIISLATSAQISLGAIPHPETGQPEPNIPAAKQMIDILALLKDKTKGNLTKDEDALLDQVLFNLRMHYVRTVEGQKKSGGS
jgi:hypothetical protein